MNNMLTIIESDPGVQRREEVETLRARLRRASSDAAQMRTVERQAKAHAEEFEKIAETNRSALASYGVRVEEGA